MKLTSITFEELMAQLPTLTEQEDKDWLALRFSLNQLPENVCDALLAAAIPHWFDSEFLNALLENPLSEEEFNSLLTLSFIEPFSARGENTYNIHEDTRKLLLKKLWEQDQPLYKKFSRKAARYCRRHHQDDVNWLMETYYHTLLIDTQDMTEKLFKLGEKWKGQHELRKLELLTRSISNLVESGKITGNAAATFYFFQVKLYYMLENDLSAKENFELALQQENIEKRLKADILYGLAGVCGNLGKYLEEENCLRQALTIYNKLNSQIMIAYCFSLFGYLYLCLSEYEKSQLFFEKALSAIQKLQNSSKRNFTKTDKLALSLLNFQVTELKFAVFLEMGKIAFLLGDYITSQQYFETSLSFSLNNLSKATSYWELGVIKLITGEEENSLVDFQESLKLFNLAGKKQYELICSVMVFALQSQTDVMLNQLDNLLKDGINLTKFVVELRQILKVCEKYPDKPAFVELRKRLETALNENKEIPP